jgi:hypothetical protein
MFFSYMHTMHFDYNLPLARSLSSPVALSRTPPFNVHALFYLDTDSACEYKQVGFVFLRLVYFT